MVRLILHTTAEIPNSESRLSDVPDITPPKTAQPERVVPGNGLSDLILFFLGRAEAFESIGERAECDIGREIQLAEEAVETQVFDMYDPGAADAAYEAGECWRMLGRLTAARELERTVEVSEGFQLRGLIDALAKAAWDSYAVLCRLENGELETDGEVNAVTSQEGEQ